MDKKYTAEIRNILQRDTVDKNNGLKSFRNDFTGRKEYKRFL